MHTEIIELPAEPKATPEPEPNGNEGTLAAVGDAVVDFITRYVALAPIQADALALWVIHTHAFEAAETTPYIAISSVGPGCGKTRALEVLELLVSNPWLTGRVTGPALVRKVDSEHPTLLLDETDALFTGGRSQEMLRGVLNSGYKLGGCTSYAAGGSYKDLDTYCPKAFAGIGGLPRTLEDRSIQIVLKKRGPFDEVKRLRHREVRDEARVPRMIAQRFAAMFLERLTRARPDIPAGLDDRASDVWEPLLAIADELGGDWPARARAAAVQLCASRRESSSENLASRLLSACKSAFDALGAERLKTQTLLEWLRDSDELDDEARRAVDAHSLSAALRPFGIASGKLRFGRQALQGYERRLFVPAWRQLGLADTIPTLDVEALAAFA